MITGDQIEKCWEAPIPAKRKLNWHEKWSDNSEFIDVMIIGFRKDRQWLQVYFYYTDVRGKRFYDLDIAEQFKLYKT